MQLWNLTWHWTNTAEPPSDLYFDTENYRLIRRSIEKPSYKEKLRIRSYRRADPESNVFVELKKKYDGVVYKRRLELPESTASGDGMYANGSIVISGGYTVVILSCPEMEKGATYTLTIGEYSGEIDAY